MYIHQNDRGGGKSGVGLCTERSERVGVIAKIEKYLYEPRLPSWLAATIHFVLFGLTIPHTFTAVSCAFSLAEMSAMLALRAKWEVIDVLVQPAATPHSACGTTHVSGRQRGDTNGGATFQNAPEVTKNTFRNQLCRRRVVAIFSSMWPPSLAFAVSTSTTSHTTRGRQHAPPLNNAIEEPKHTMNHSAKTTSTALSCVPYTWWPAKTPRRNSPGTRAPRDRA